MPFIIVSSSSLYRPPRPAPHSRSWPTPLHIGLLALRAHCMQHSPLPWAGPGGAARIWLDAVRCCRGKRASHRRAGVSRRARVCRMLVHGGSPRVGEVRGGNARACSPHPQCIHNKAGPQGQAREQGPTPRDWPWGQRTEEEVDAPFRHVQQACDHYRAQQDKDQPERDEPPDGICDARKDQPHGAPRRGVA